MTTPLMERTRAILIANPLLPYERAESYAKAQLADEGRAELIASSLAEQSEWKASGRPLSEFYAGTWREHAATQARETLDGTIPEKTAGELAEELQAAIDAGDSPFSAGGRIEYDYDAARKEAEARMVAYRNSPERGGDR